MYIEGLLKNLFFHIRNNFMLNQGRSTTLIDFSFRVFLAISEIGTLTSQFAICGVLSGLNA